MGRRRALGVGSRCWVCLGGIIRVSISFLIGGLVGGLGLFCSLDDGCSAAGFSILFYLMFLFLFFYEFILLWAYFGLLKQYQMALISLMSYYRRPKIE